ncbi:MAG: RnfH family protein [Legionella sp.]|nr:MAG: RnfH family protein [Legionella sp.]
MVRVELVYIAQDQTIVHQRLELPEGAIVHDALKQSGIYLSHPETQELVVGIYAKPVSLERVLQDGDRLELYRALLRDPKEKRRLQAKRVKK